MNVKQAVVRGLVKSVVYDNTGAHVTDTGREIVLSRMQYWNSVVEKNIREEVMPIVNPRIEYKGWGGKEMGYVVEVSY